MTQTPTEASVDQPPRNYRALALMIALRTIVAVVAIALVYVTFNAGLDARRRTFENTKRLRHPQDYALNLYWGTRALDEGYYDLFGKVYDERKKTGQFGLDYPPLRLLVFRQWAAAARAKFPENRELQTPAKGPGRAGLRPDYEFGKPLLMFAAIVEAIGAASAFLLVRLWVRRAAQARKEDAPPAPAPAVGLRTETRVTTDVDPLADANATVAAAPPVGAEPVLPLDYARPTGAQGAAVVTPRISAWTGILPATIAALLVWFSPASMLSGHGWPSSDVWVPATFLLTALLASYNCWFAAGIVLGLSMLMKGQQVVVAPVFLLWPLFMGRWDAALRLVGGCALAMAIVLAPWLLREETTHQLHAGAVAWVIGVLLAGVLATVRKALIKDRRVRIGLLVAIALLLSWPWVYGTPHYLLTLQIASVAVALAVLLAALLPLRWHPQFSTGLAGLAVLVCPVRFPSDLMWYRLGFVYGAERFPRVSQFISNTVPALLERRFGWEKWEEIVFHIGRTPVTLKTTMFSIYAICLVIAAAAMAVHTLRRDRRFLVALGLPWMAAYAFMPQMHGRYLLFPATVGAVMIGAGVGFALLDVLLIALAWLAIAVLMTGSVGAGRPIQEYVGPEWESTVRPLVQNTSPDTAWIIALIALTVLYGAIIPSRPLRIRARFTDLRSRVHAWRTHRSAAAEPAGG